MISEQDAAWREEWIATIQRRARVEVPALLRSARAQRLQPFTTATETVAAVADPITPIPDGVAHEPETGGIPRLPRETAMISAVRLLEPAIAVRETSELVSMAVRRFFARHGSLPNTCMLNPLRVLAIEHPEFYPLNDDAANIGCYTIRVEEAENFPIDAVRLLVRYGGITIREDYAL